MDAGLLSFLKGSGITQETILILEDELILSKEIFMSLKEEHFTKLLPKLKVGQHVCLKQLWDTGQFKDLKKGFEKFSKSSADTGGSSCSGSPSVRARTRSRSPLSHCTSTDDESHLLTSKRSMKELAELYKSNAIRRFNKGKKTASPERSPSTMKILLGGMIFDKKKNKGIRRKCLPEPNPTKVELKNDSTLNDIFKKSIELYYKEYPDITLSDVMLTNSSGIAVEIENPNEWRLLDYYTKNQYVPSRHKLYTMIDLDKDKETVMDNSSSETDTKIATILEETEAVVRECIDCQRKFRTYVPDTICSLPGGGSVTYPDPQLTCPLCDSKGWGAFMNYDLFPELIPHADPMAQLEAAQQNI